MHTSALYTKMPLSSHCFRSIRIYIFFVVVHSPLSLFVDVDDGLAYYEKSPQGWHVGNICRPSFRRQFRWVACVCVCVCVPNATNKRIDFYVSSSDRPVGSQKWTGFLDHAHAILLHNAYATIDDQTDGINYCFYCPIVVLFHISFACAALVANTQNSPSIFVTSVSDYVMVLCYTFFLFSHERIFSNILWVWQQQEIWATHSEIQTNTSRRYSTHTHTHAAQKISRFFFYFILFYCRIFSRPTASGEKKLWCKVSEIEINSDRKPLEKAEQCVGHKVNTHSDGVMLWNECKCGANA